MKYVVVDEKNGDIFTKETDDLNKALDYAALEWEHMSKHDRSKRDSYFVLESINPDEEAENHLDGKVIKSYK